MENETKKPELEVSLAGKKETPRRPTLRDLAADAEKAIGALLDPEDPVRTSTSWPIHIGKLERIRSDLGEYLAEKPAPTIVTLDPARLSVGPPEIQAVAGRTLEVTARRLDDDQAQALVDKATRFVRVLSAARSLVRLVQADKLPDEAPWLGAEELEAALAALADPGLPADGPRTLPELLVAERKARGLSFDDLAEVVGVHSGTIRRWESGATVPGFEDLRRLVAAGLDPTEILGLPSRPAVA